MHQGVRNVRLSENLTCFVFLSHAFWDSPFCLITDYFNEPVQRKDLVYWEKSAQLHSPEFENKNFHEDVN